MPATMPRSAATGISPISPVVSARRRARPTDERIHHELSDAIIDHRIPPGVALPEDALAGAFGVSRTVIRKALLRLGHEKLVELRPNRGAVVARPTIEQARQVFEARRVIEAAVVATAVERATSAQLAAIQSSLTAEADAERRGDRRGLIRLSGDFHRALAAAAHNDVLVAFLGELISRSSLILALYQSSGAMPCSHDDHAAILEAIARRDVAAAQARMAQHLTEIERRLDLGASVASVNLHAMFAHIRARSRRRA
jgi:DNA-binding GntR family transcriptional regulator